MQINFGSKNRNQILKRLSLLAAFALCAWLAVTPLANTTNDQEVSALNNLIAIIKSEQRVITQPTLGIELEGVYPGETRESAFREIEQIFLNEIAPVIQPDWHVQLEHYDFETRHGDPRKGTRVVFNKTESDRPPIVWQVKDDGSIQAPKNHVGVEIVSPILHDNREIKNFYTVLQKLKAHKLKPEPHSAALQVHVGMTTDGPLSTEFVPEKIKAEALLFIWFFSKIEKQLIQLYETTEARKKFAMPTPAAAVKEIIAGHALSSHRNLHEFIEDHYNYRYWALNPHSLFQFGTFELRFANSTVDSKVLSSLIDLGVKLTIAIKSADPRLVELMTTYAGHDEMPLEKVAEQFKLKWVLNKLGKSCAAMLN